MTEKYQFVRKYPLSLLCLVLIMGLSFTPIFPETPLDGVQMIDKWTHLVMYGGSTAVIWWEYLRCHQHIDWERMVVVPLIGMVLLGGLVELGQAYLTTYRSGEWMDFAADTVGCFLGNAVGLLLMYGWWRRRHDGRH